MSCGVWLAQSPLYRLSHAHIQDFLHAREHVSKSMKLMSQYLDLGRVREEEQHRRQEISSPILIATAMHKAYRAIFEKG
jgi:hypothetical protein